MIGVWRHRPSLCAAAGVSALWPMCLVSIVGFPLLIASSAMVWAPPHNRPRRNEIAIVALLGVALVAVFAFVVFHQDPRRFLLSRCGRTRSGILLKHSSAGVKGGGACGDESSTSSAACSSRLG
jgi:hypothetical protein